MMQALVHRGPDDSGFEQVDLDRAGVVAGLGFRRLSVVDLSSTGHQPIVNPATGDCLIFNGEIYNFRELRRELESMGIRFRGRSDSEVLLHALSSWGDRVLPRLVGMYAFAFYRARDRRVLLARDPLGIKPLYVAALPGCFLFASEVRALLASGRVPRDLDVAGMAGMLAYGSVQSPRTVFSAVRSFPAGHSQWIDGSVAEGISPAPPRRFWSFPARTWPFDGDLGELLKEAVGRHLVSDVPIGVFLSAGIDSTIIASLAKEVSPNVKAFTVGFSEAYGDDETAVAAATARSIGIEHRFVELTSASMPKRWLEWSAGMDSPSVDGFNTWVVSQSLAQEGVVVGLSGVGADELFGGYSTFGRVIRMARRLRSPFFASLVRAASATGLTKLGGNLSSIEKLNDAIDGDWSIASIALASRRVLSNHRLAALGLVPASLGLAPDWLEQGPERIDPVTDGDEFNTMARIEATHYMRDTLLRDTDANSMQHSLEIRVPFLDQRLFDTVSALPGREKWTDSPQGKQLLRAACASRLPDAVTRRPKTGFTLPIGPWMARELRDACQAAIDHLASVPPLDGREVHRTWDQFCADPASIHWSRPLSLVVLGGYLARNSAAS